MKSFVVFFIFVVVALGFFGCATVESPPVINSSRNIYEGDCKSHLERWAVLFGFSAEAERITEQPVAKEDGVVLCAGIMEVDLDGDGMDDMDDMVFYTILEEVIDIEEYVQVLAGTEWESLKKPTREILGKIACGEGGRVFIVAGFPYGRWGWAARIVKAEEDLDKRRKMAARVIQLFPEECESLKDFQ